MYILPVCIIGQLKTPLQVEEHHNKDILSVVYNRASDKFFYRLKPTTTKIFCLR